MQGKARIYLGKENKTYGLALIRVLIINRITALGSIKTTVSSSISAKARISVYSTNFKQYGRANIYFKTTANINGLGRIASISSIQTNGLSRIQSVKNYSITALSNIGLAKTSAINAISRIFVKYHQEILGKARIQGLSSRNQTGKARVILSSANIIVCETINATICDSNISSTICQASINVNIYDLISGNSIICTPTVPVYMENII